MKNTGQEQIFTQLYKRMLKSRMIEEKMLTLLRQGKVSKWFSGIGQEAISVGVTSVLTKDEFILPMHRNLGVFLSKNVPLSKLFAQWQGKVNGFTKGRDRSFHFGSIEHKVIGMISHLGPQLAVATGIALGHKLRGEQNITAVFSGEGGTSEGDFHEALNIASVWKLPVLFCIENNGYALSTPTETQYACDDLADRGYAYGMEAFIIDGNDVVEIYLKLRHIASEMRKNPRPVLVEFKTFRVRGHEEASGTAYVPENLISTWMKKDPVLKLQKALLKSSIIDEARVKKYRSAIKTEIDTEWKNVESWDFPVFDAKNELQDVYKEFELSTQKNIEVFEDIRFIDAIKDAIFLSMARDKSVIIMGQDIAEYGGVFKATEGLLQQFGKERVRNTPLCESGIISCSAGLSINKFKVIVEMQFADFVSSGFNPIVNYLAKQHYRWGANADVVIRMPCGGGVGAGPFHSQSNEAWFAKVPGLKIAYPSNPQDAKGLLTAAIEDPNPVLFFEHKKLYRSQTSKVPVGYYSTPFGQANIVHSGEDMLVISYGMAVQWVMDIVSNDTMFNNIAVLDLRTIVPLDEETVLNWSKKCSKILIVTEDSEAFSVVSHISHLITSRCFEFLEAPVEIIGSLDTPIPFHKNLEEGYMCRSRLESKMKQLLMY
ncbi:MAG: dehydrogenase [Flavobacteriaceae bacterium]|nr:dehydrogenase [Flavobacteriaceae bacterium]